MFEWSSRQYKKFINERTQPAIDLVNRININNPKSIIDIGCGPGNSTSVLAQAFKNCKIIGADNSRDMVNSAKEKYPDLDFMLFDASKDFTSIDQKFDIVFSNACIQWITEHRILLKNMMSILNKNGVLAVQIPMNYDEPIHRIIIELAESEKWKDKFPNTRVINVLSKGEYFDVLSEISSDFSMWETTYYHRMKSHEGIMEWYKGTGLRPYLSALNETDALEFENEVYKEVVKAYPKQVNGEVIFRFPRLFFTAVK